ncbi:MAG: histidine kinase dimerization/phosphoacceptor domain -containing protein [Methanobacteriaceae archaeon]
MLSEHSNILLIEDNLGDIVLFKSMLEDAEDYLHLKVVESLKDSLKILNKSDFDVIILDLGLPDSNGFETFIQVHNHSPQIPIIILTGLDDEKLGVRAFNEGAQDYLIKGQIDSKLVHRSIKYAIERQAYLKKRDLMIKEIYHRMKNNMQIISSLLSLQGDYVEDIKILDILKKSQTRVISMAILHEKLYQSKYLSWINTSDYIQSLVQDLFKTHIIEEGKITPIIEVDDVKLNIKTAVPCGLIINELLTNSLKYAFPHGRSGEIHVTLKAEDDKFKLTISDNGIGFPEDIDFKNTESLGLKLVNSLTNQIDGNIELDRSQGTKFKITFANTVQV